MIIAEGHCKFKESKHAHSMDSYYVKSDHCASMCTGILTSAILLVASALNAQKTALGVVITTLAIGAGATHTEQHACESDFDAYAENQDSMGNNSTICENLESMH